MADDLSAALEEIRGNILQAEQAGMSGDLDRVIYTHGLMTGTARRLSLTLEAVLNLHACEGWYLAAGDCDHPPLVDDGSDEWHEWDAAHPPGTGHTERICLATRLDSFCPECTRLKFGDEEPDGEFYVRAPCTTRSAILAELTGEGGNGV